MWGFRAEGVSIAQESHPWGWAGGRQAGGRPEGGMKAMNPVELLTFLGKPCDL